MYRCIQLLCRFYVYRRRCLIFQDEPCEPKCLQAPSSIRVNNPGFILCYRSGYTLLRLQRSVSRRRVMIAGRHFYVKGMMAEERSPRGAFRLYLYIVYTVWWKAIRPLLALCGWKLQRVTISPDAGAGLLKGHVRTFFFLFLEQEIIQISNICVLKILFLYLKPTGAVGKNMVQSIVMDQTWRRHVTHVSFFNFINNLRLSPHLRRKFPSKRWQK